MQTKQPAIILIEREDVTLDLYRRELSKYFEVLSFTKTDGVLDTLSHREIEAVIIEPEINSGQGWSLVHAIDAAFPDHSMPVIVCSTRDACDAHVTEAVSRYLTKPVLPVKLKETALELLKKNTAKKIHG